MEISDRFIINNAINHARTCMIGTKMSDELLMHTVGRMRYMSYDVAGENATWQTLEASAI